MGINLKYEDMLSEDFERIGLDKFPDEPYANVMLPIRISKKWNYQVWTGEKWVKLKTKEVKEEK